MPVHNSDIADIFKRLADLLEIRGENPFRVRAYRTAARTLEDMSGSAEEMVRKNEDFTFLPGIGKDLAAKIREIILTGKLSVFEDLRHEMPEELGRMMEIAGLGPKRILQLYQILGINSIADLENAAREKKISKLRGFGEKTEKRILEDLKRTIPEKNRMLLPAADEMAAGILAYMKKFHGIKQIDVAGSYRRRRETIGDLDILVTVGNVSGMMDHFIQYPDAVRVIAKGETRSSLIIRSGIQVDLRVVPEPSYGAALHYFTGSKSHNIAIRKRGLRKGLKINEYGVFREDKPIAGKSEEEVYSTVGLPYIEPELREDRGEIEAAEQGRLPRLVTLKDIRGDLHAHTKLTDGRSSLEEMVEGARARGYEYLAITEHSKRLAMARGLDSERLANQINEIDKLNRKIRGIVILKGIEVDILEDGSLDLPDDILKELDIVVCSVHSKFNLPGVKQTERIIRAMDNPYFNILGHPSGRLLLEREPYDLNMERVMEAAKERGCFLEVNAHPHRLDLTDVFCKMAKETGVKITISTDAHSVSNLDFIRYGVGQARRGWIEPEDVINTRKLDDLRKLLIRT